YTYWLGRSEGGHPRDVRGHISAEDSGFHSLLCDHGNIGECVSSPVIAVGLGVNVVAERAAPLDLSLQSQRVAGLMRSVDQNDAVRSSHETVVGATQSGLSEHIGG